jgi:hypothetical protein
MSEKLNLPEVPVEEKESFFESVRTKLAVAFVAVVGVIAYFTGIFPELQAPMIDLEVAKVFINGVALVITGLLVGRSMRNTPTGSGSVLTLVSELLAMLVKANKEPFPKEE